MESTEKPVCVFGVTPGDFNTVLLKKNPEEEKEWGKKPGGWGRPGGTKKPGETEEEALEREYREETGFYIEVRPETRYAEEKENVIDVTFICYVYGGKQKNGCNWFPLDKLPKSIYSSHRRIILLMAEKYKRKTDIKS